MGERETFLPPARNLLAGAAAGFANNAVMHPVDTLRARLNVAKAGSITQNPIKAIAAMLGKTWRQDGIRGLYRGYGTALLFTVPGSSVYFTSYEFWRHTLPRVTSLDRSSWAVQLLSGFGAELFASAVFTPCDVMKQRMQVQGTEGRPLLYSNTFHALREITRTGGVRELYRGYGACMCTFGPYSAIYFVTYEQLKARVLRLRTTRDNVSAMDGPASFPLHLGCGVTAGAVAAAASQPLDAAKTRLQVIQASGRLRANIFTVLRDTAASEGVAVLFRGTLARVAWLAPGCGITITVFEALKEAG